MGYIEKSSFRLSGPPSQVFVIRRPERQPRNEASQAASVTAMRQTSPCLSTLLANSTTCPSPSLIVTGSTTEPVKRPALALEGIDDVERRDCLTLGVLGIGDCITDDTFKKRLEDSAGLFVNH